MLTIIGKCIDCGCGIIDESDVGINLTDRCLDCDYEHYITHRDPAEAAEVDELADMAAQYDAARDWDADEDIPF